MMRWLANLRTSLRYVRMRFLESFLAIMGTTLGVAVIAASAALLSAYDQSAAKELSSPIYKQIQAVPQSFNRTEDIPVTRVTDTGQTVVTIKTSDLATIKASCPSIDYAYTVSRQGARVGDLPTGRGGFGGFGGQNATTTAAGSTSAAKTSAANGASASPATGAATTATSAANGATTSDMPFDFGGPGDWETTTATDTTEVATVTPLIDEFELVRATSDFYDAYEFKIASGSMFTEKDVTDGSNVLVLGSALAKKMFGDANPIGAKFRVNGTMYTVIGILAPTATSSEQNGMDIDSYGFAPYVESRSRFNFMGMISLGTKDANKVKAAVTQAQTYFDKTYGENSFTLSSSLKQAEEYQANHQRLFLVIGFLAAAALLISAVNLFNLMTTRVTRRSRSIGVLRSFGASKSDIFHIFLGETLALTILGGILGFIIAPFLYQLLAARVIPASWGLDTQAGFDWLAMIVALVAAMALNAVFGAVPALKASRTEIVTSIKAE